MKQQSFIAGAFVLTLAGIFSRIMGAMYRIPLSRMLGPEGLGLYELAYPVYSILLAVSLGGVPLAISKLVAECQAAGDLQGTRKVFWTALTILFVSGLSCSLLLFYGAHFVAYSWLKDNRVYYCLVSVAPAVFLVSLMAVFRGLYQGLQLMTPTAVSQVAEQFVRMLTMLGLAYFLLPYGLEYAAAGATFGAVTGGLAGLIYFLIFHFRQGRRRLIGKTGGKSRETCFSIAKKICYFSLPIILGGMTMPFLNMIYASLVPLRLQAVGYTMREATNLYGQLTGMAVTLMNFPTVITSALATSLVPAIARSFALKECSLLAWQIEESVRLTLLVALPASAGLHILSYEICDLLFACPSAGLGLKVLAFGVIFLCLHETVSAVFQGMGQTVLPVKNLFLGAISTMLGILFFTRRAEFALQGIALSTVSGFALACFCDLWFLRRTVNCSFFQARLLIRLGLAVLGMGAVVRTVYDWALCFSLSNGFSLMLAIALGILTYTALLLLFGLLKRRDFRWLECVDLRRFWFCRK